MYTFADVVQAYEVESRGKCINYDRIQERKQEIWVEYWRYQRQCPDRDRGIRVPCRAFGRGKIDLREAASEDGRRGQGAHHLQRL